MIGLTGLFARVRLTRIHVSVVLMVIMMGSLFGLVTVLPIYRQQVLKLERVPS